MKQFAKGYPMFFRRVFLLLLFITPCALYAQREKLPPDDLAWVEKNFPSVKKSNTGIRYLELEKGSGETAKRGDMVSMVYVGRLINGESFDQSIDPKKPLRFRLGRDKVIQGWDQIIQLMSPGDKWLVIIPPELAYGTRGRPPSIPPETTLIFTMQLIAVNQE